MELKQGGKPSSLWRSAVKGGLIATVTPFVLGFGFVSFVSNDAQVGITWMLVALVLASPIIFLLGAAGGLLAHVARGRNTSGPVDRPTTRWARAGWILAGAIVGVGGSELTLFQWPIIGGALIGMTLIPVWVWIGVALARRVAVSQSAARPALGGAIVAGAGFALLSNLLPYGSLPLNHRQLLVATGSASAAVGLFTWLRLIKAQPRSSRVV
jgi:hypothetical protein